MSAENIEAGGIHSLGQLFQGLSEGLQTNGLSKNTAATLASEFADHEGKHVFADSMKNGELGFVITPGWIVAYYLIHGERTPLERMQIASAPGFSEMSQQDWNIYNSAYREWLIEVKEERYSNSRVEETSYSEVKSQMVSIMTQKMNEFSRDGNFPSLENVVDQSIQEIFEKYGALIYHAFQHALITVGRAYMVSHGGASRADNPGSDLPITIPR